MTASADREAWDARVEAADPGSYLQLGAWADVKAVNGWAAHRIITGDEIGAQVLVRRPAPLPWGFAYAPRGPVARSWSAEEVGSFTAAVRADLPAAAGRVSHLRIDPEIERDGAARSTMAGSAVRCATPGGVRPPRSSRRRRASSISRPTRTHCGATCARNGAST